EPTGIFGVCQVTKEAYPDPFALDPKSKYYDADAKKKGLNPWVAVDVKAHLKFTRPVLRDDLKKVASLSDMLVLKKGSRLSVQPVKEREFKIILELGQPVSA
ncbi:MAG: EVE domain-containing protein, partial [Proteobacteria bacterium]|nr:EVE domain-containing protein [Pseudomonadota bacterium]